MRLDDFHQFLYRFPSLGLAHPLGREIHERLRQLPLIALEAKSWYRGIEQKTKPKFDDFLPLDPARVAVPEQRFNHQGERVFYLANTARGAALECSEENSKPIWVQRIRIARAEKILDVTKNSTGSMAVREESNSKTSRPHVLPVDFLISAATYCGPREPICRPEHLKPEYRVPRFVSECARQAGAHGLLVPSTKEGTNLVLFTWRDEDVTAEGQPQKIAAD